MPSNIGKVWHPLPKPQLKTLVRRTNFRPQWEPTGHWFRHIRDIPYGEGMDKTLHTYMVIFKGNFTKVFNYEAKGSEQYVKKFCQNQL